MTRLWLARTALISAALLAGAPAYANWVASGVFKYQERQWDKDGFTGLTSNVPIRYADIEIVDVNKSGSKAIVARGKTDATGAYSLSVTDSSTRTIKARVLSSTTQTPDLFAQVTNKVTGSIYSVSSANYANHTSTTNVNFGTLLAVAGNGGEAFNILDMAVFGADFIKSLTGTRPNSGKLVNFRWAVNGGVSGSATAGNTVTLRDTAGYDDTVILHEWSHYVMYHYSKSSSPAGAHFLSDCNEDVRLAFDEGRASFFGASVRRYNGFPNANIYLRTNGTSGTGGFVNGYDMEDQPQYACMGDASEVTVSRSLWDIGDGPSTNDLTPGVDDSHDLLGLPDSEVWQVFTGPIKNATYVVHERFWDGWFDPTIANGYVNEMKGIFDYFTIQYYQDAFEPNQSSTGAPAITSNAGPIHLTYFADPDGNGQGAADSDFFRLDAVGGVTYTIETVNLTPRTDTMIEVRDTNGTTVLVSNDDRTASDLSSVITWTAPRTDAFYIKTLDYPSDYKIYGFFDLQVTNP